MRGQNWNMPSCKSRTTFELDYHERISSKYRPDSRKLVSTKPAAAQIAVGRVPLLWVGFRQSQSGHERMFGFEIAPLSSGPQPRRINVCYNRRCTASSRSLRVDEWVGRTEHTPTLTRLLFSVYLSTSSIHSSSQSSSQTTSFVMVCNVPNTRSLSPILILLTCSRLQEIAKFPKPSVPWPEG
jgi:hypothetical protein